jgi:hypothetical protein
MTPDEFASLLTLVVREEPAEPLSRAAERRA